MKREKWKLFSGKIRGGRGDSCMDCTVFGLFSNFRDEYLLTRLNKMSTKIERTGNGVYKNLLYGQKLVSWLASKGQWIG